MGEFHPLERVREHFQLQKVMETLGMKLLLVEEGRVEIGFDYREDLTQQHGFIHAGVLATALDSACGYAAYSMMDEHSEVLSVEFKTNLMRPAKGDRFVARAEVVKPGRNMFFTEARAFALTGESERLVASMSGTMMALRS